MSLSVQHVTRDIVLWLSAFSIGTALFTAALCLRMVKANPRRYLSFAAAKVGYALAIGTVLLRILLPLSEVAPTAWAWAYTLGVAVAGVGFIGIGRAVRIEFIEWEAQRDANA